MDISLVRSRLQRLLLRNATPSAVQWKLGQIRERIGRKLHPTKVYEVSSGENRLRFVQELRTELTARGLAHLHSGTRAENRRTIPAFYVSVEDLEGFLDALGAVQSRGFDLYARHSGRWTYELRRPVLSRLGVLQRSFKILLVERRIKKVSQVQCTGVWVELLAPQIDHDGTQFLKLQRCSPLISRLRTESYQRLASSGYDLDQEFPAFTVPQFDIDVVYTWVDGSDPEWLAKKSKCSAEAGRVEQPRVMHDARFRSRDELRYSLRSLELFAPWVRHIYLVTAGQCPEWLNRSHPQITLIDHRDIYSDPSHLPTFNSSGIETQLHHIPGLTQKFLYFNDDFLFGRPVFPGDFFYANGALKYFESDVRVLESDIDTRSEEYIQADKNAIELFKQEFPGIGRSIMQHVPYPCDRDLLAELESKYREQFRACAGSRFRSSRDLRPIAFMQYHYGFLDRRALPSKISHRYLALWKPTIVEQMNKVLARRAHKTFCINDVLFDAAKNEHVDRAVREFLEAYFPLPSRFEK